MGSGSKEIKAANASAVIAMLGLALSLTHIQETLPQLQTLMENKKWQIKEGALLVLAGLAEVGKTGWETKELGANSRLADLEVLLPETLPTVVELVRDTKTEVSVAAKAALRALVKLCTHKETVKLRDELIAAIEDPAKTEATIEHFMVV